MGALRAQVEGLRRSDFVKYLRRAQHTGSRYMAVYCSLSCAAGCAGDAAADGRVAGPGGGAAGAAQGGAGRHPGRGVRNLHNLPLIPKKPRNDGSPSVAMRCVGYPSGSASAGTLAVCIVMRMSPVVRDDTMPAMSRILGCTTHTASSHRQNCVASPALPLERV